MSEHIVALDPATSPATYSDIGEPLRETCPACGAPFWRNQGTGRMYADDGRELFACPGCSPSASAEQPPLCCELCGADVEPAGAVEVWSRECGLVMACVACAGPGSISDQTAAEREDDEPGYRNDGEAGEWIPLPDPETVRAMHGPDEPTLAALQAENAQLRRRVADLLWNAPLNCPRRPAIEEAWPTIPHSRYALILFDLDGLNAANYALGWGEVDRRIAAVWDGIRAHLRSSDPHGQWMGGDEFLIAVPALDAEGLAARVQTLLQFVGLSASRAIVAAGPNLAATVESAERLIKAARGGARGEGQRGVWARAA